MAKIATYPVRYKSLFENWLIGTPEEIYYWFKFKINDWCCADEFYAAFDDRLLYWYSEQGYKVAFDLRHLRLYRYLDGCDKPSAWRKSIELMRKFPCDLLQLHVADIMEA